MGTITRKFDEKVDCIMTESYVYTPVDLSLCKDVKRVKVVRSLWDTGASVSLIIGADNGGYWEIVTNATR